MAVKRIAIGPDILIQLLNAARDAQGNPLLPVTVTKPFRINRAIYDIQRQEFLMEVDSPAFDERPGGPRMPQTFNVQIKK